MSTKYSNDPFVCEIVEDTWDTCV